MSTDQLTLYVFIKRGTDGVRGRRIKFVVNFRELSCGLALNYIKLTDSEGRRMAIRMIQKLRKCSEPEAIIRYIIGRRTLRSDTGPYYLREIDVKCSKQEIERIFLEFVKESSHIPHVTIQKRTKINEFDEEFAKMAISRGMPINLKSLDSLPMSILRLQIENYFKGGPFAHVKYGWLNYGSAPFDLKELLSGFPIHYSPPIFELSCYQRHYIQFRRKEGDPILRLKIHLCSGKHEQRCYSPCIGLYTDIVGERRDISYDDFCSCCFEFK